MYVGVMPHSLLRTPQISLMRTSLRVSPSFGLKPSSALPTSGCKLTIVDPDDQAESNLRCVSCRGKLVPGVVDCMFRARSGYAAFIGLALLLRWSVDALGQAATPPSGTPTIHVTTDLIQLPVLALKPPFRSASGLTRSNFTIRLDGGSPFHPSYLRTERDEPMVLGMVVDADPSEPLQLSRGLQAAIQRWPADLLHGTDRLSFYVLGCRLVRSLDNAPADLNQRRDSIVHAASFSNFQTALEGGKACQRPPMEKVLEAVIYQIAKNAEWKVLLLIVNGERPTDMKSLRRVQAIAATQGVTLFAIKYLKQGSFPASVYSATEGLNVLVSSLGGISVHSSFDDLGDVTETIITIIRQRYILSFPRPGNGSAGAHRLEINTNAKGVIVRSSAASAPLLDTTHCTGADGTWLCPEQRPQYGTSKPPE
jgi:hypothetical protein